jgi:transcriptional regulator with XRE-family HTH domain
MDRNHLAEFLRSKRERLRPQDVGLPVSGPRRTPGLRREEVAWLANISVEYYARLEQARGSNPSGRVLIELARALRLTPEERSHLFNLAGVAAESPAGAPSEVPPSVLSLIDHMTDVAALVLNACYDIVAWNALAVALFEDFSALAPERRNLVYRHFLDPDPASRHYGLANAEEFGSLAVGRLRGAAGRYPNDPHIRTLITTLYERSPEFARLWEDGDVEVGYHRYRTMRHPVVGTLEFDCVPVRDHYLICFTAPVGSPSYDALRLLSVPGIESAQLA